MEGLDFLLTAIGFSVLGYGLCYMTLSVKHKTKTHNVDLKTPVQSLALEESVQEQQRYSA